jgi:hypothetical protein
MQRPSTMRRRTMTSHLLCPITVERPGSPPPMACPPPPAILLLPPPLPSPSSSRLWICLCGAGNMQHALGVACCLSPPQPTHGALLPLRSPATPTRRFDRQMQTSEQANQHSYKQTNKQGRLNRRLSSHLPRLPAAAAVCLSRRRQVVFNSI